MEIMQPSFHERWYPYKTIQFILSCILQWQKCISWIIEEKRFEHGKARSWSRLKKVPNQICKQKRLTEFEKYPWKTLECESIHGALGVGVVVTGHALRLRTKIWQKRLFPNFQTPRTCFGTTGRYTCADEFTKTKFMNVEMVKVIKGPFYTTYMYQMKTPEPESIYAGTGSPSTSPLGEDNISQLPGLQRKQCCISLWASQYNAGLSINLSMLKLFFSRIEH